MSARAQRIRRPALALATLLALALAACAQREEHEHTEPSALGERAAANEAREWLDQVSSAHARADEALAAGQHERAREVLSAALERAVPARLGNEHARVVRQDLWYRLSAIGVERAPQQALLEAERGLALGRHDDLFSANLLIARGRALQALGRDTEAASSYHGALKIEERLLNEALGAGRDGGP
jgi:hypothetical protein